MLWTTRQMLIFSPFMAMLQWSLSHPDKSESILFGTHQRLQTFPAVPPIKISGTENQTLWKYNKPWHHHGLPANLRLMRTFTALCKACYFHLRSLRHIRRSLTDDMSKSIAVALVQSRLDYCNSLLFGVSQFNLDKLQRVQNLAARLALNDWRSPIPHLFVKLHWLPIHSCIKFKFPRWLSNFCPTTNPQTSDLFWHRMLLLVCWGHLTSVSLLSRELALQLVNVLSMCALLLYGTQYRCTFGFLRHLHR